MRRELYGEIRRREADHWWYVGRQRILFDWTRRAVARRTAPRLLDVGCGTGFNLEGLRALGVAGAVGLDVSAEALAYCQARGLRRLVRADGALLPFADSSFDVVLAFDLLEHLKDDESALERIAGVLRPGGALIVFTPAYRFLWSLQDEVSHHVRRYTAGELGRKLTGAGFEIVKLSYANTLLFPAVWAGRLALRWRRRSAPEHELDLHPAWSNRLLGRVFAWESRLLRHVNLPFGVSLLSLAVRR